MIRSAFERSFGSIPNFTSDVYAIDNDVMMRLGPHMPCIPMQLDATDNETVSLYFHGDDAYFIKNDSLIMKVLNFNKIISKDRFVTQFLH